MNSSVPSGKTTRLSLPETRPTSRWDYTTNIWAEKSYNAEWKHKPQQLVTKLAVTAVGIAGIIALIATNDKKPRIKSSNQR